MKWLLDFTVTWCIFVLAAAIMVPLALLCWAVERLDHTFLRAVRAIRKGGGR